MIFGLIKDKWDIMDESVFALDIGTRTVVGLIASGDPLTVSAACVIEHRERSMQDGQIHDIEKVAKVVLQVKSDIEEQIGQELTEVSVAVAGRALKTSRAKVSVDIPFNEISKQDLVELEFEGIAKARVEVGMDEGFNCVGYTVVHSELDGQIISNLVGQKGQHVSIEVLATFLPDAVVNSMFSVLKRAGLKATSLTLEPIAALNVAIPPDMRKLNLALVDVGAGTSDIAVTAGGTVIGYGMVPEAGDEITDIICDHYLVDFNRGEQIKRSLSSGEDVDIEDIFGIVEKVPASDVIAVIEDKVDDLSKKISESILDINEKPPRAVVCIGGGSQTVNLKQYLSTHLKVVPQRVGMRLPNAIEIVDNTGKVAGVDMITPLGIALTAQKQLGIDFMDVLVDDSQVHMMDINGLTVMDALVAAKIRKIHARLGMAQTMEVNCSFMTIEGTFGKHAQVLLNGAEAKLGDTLKKGDSIDFIPPVDGGDACISAIELAKRAGFSQVNVSINGKESLLHPIIIVNGSKAGPNDNIPDRANVMIKQVTIGDVPNILGMHDENDSTIQVMLNNSVKFLEKSRYEMTVNGKIVDADDDHELVDGDEVIIEKNKFGSKIEDVVGPLDAGKSVSITLNDEKITFDGKRGTVTLNGSNANLLDKISDGDVIVVENGKDANPIMSDVFEFMNINREELVGKTIRMYVDGVSARFMTALSDGSKVTVEFE